MQSDRQIYLFTNLCRCRSEVLKNLNLSIYYHYFYVKRFCNKLKAIFKLKVQSNKMVKMKT